MKEREKEREREREREKDCPTLYVSKLSHYLCDKKRIIPSWPVQTITILLILFTFADNKISVLYGLNKAF